MPDARDLLRQDRQPCWQHANRLRVWAYRWQRVEPRGADLTRRSHPEFDIPVDQRTPEVVEIAYADSGRPRWKNWLKSLPT